ncbi:SRPBCC family protein [uncultured Lacinutrix sp.]|uniref:SRPBCC family protein n=1 Tax=uncultured Lacinutrix sp. TaxID=574032 RepID=UPI00261DAC6E|nr:SRPBCC family protein [uncultured Lacinutrix sp.]
MKYTSEIIIEVPIEVFVKKMDNQDNMKHWQRGLQSYEHIHGEPGKTGAKMKLNYKFGKRLLTLTETITSNNLPNAFHVNYDTKGLHNVQKNYFESTPEGYTKWICKSEFIPTGLIMHFMTLLMPKTFKKQSMQYLSDFKNFVEKGISVYNA